VAVEDSCCNVRACLKLHNGIRAWLNKWKCLKSIKELRGFRQGEYLNWLPAVFDATITEVSITTPAPGINFTVV
jgi:hypothetical protein